ncbi:response regulator transcription factor [Paracoccus siganidrum]|nr:response regulator [Paracoccus siganidrum]
MPQELDILMIEDETNIAEAVRFILTREGWRIGLHPEGKGAMQRIRAARPRLVILDLMLPGRSGAEILAELRADTDAGLAATPVLMLTARGQGPAVQPLAEKADALLAKPFSNDDLRRVVRELLA